MSLASSPNAHGPKHLLKHMSSSSRSIHHASHAIAHKYDDITHIFTCLSSSPEIINGNGAKKTIPGVVAREVINAASLPIHTPPNTTISTHSNVTNGSHTHSQSNMFGPVQLTHPIQIITKNKRDFLSKYLALIKDGSSKLKIVTDFDFTMTKYHILKNVPGDNQDSKGDSQSTPESGSNHPAMNTPNPNPHSMASAVSTHLPRQLSNQKLRSLSSASLGSSGSMTNMAEGFASPTKSHQHISLPMMIRHRGISCHGVLEDCHLLHKEFHEQSVATFQKYYPIEMDPHIAYEAKYQYMMEWAKMSQNLLVHKSGLTFSLLKKAVHEAVLERRIELRASVRNFLENLKQQDIPLLIFSAGIADILEKVLEESLTHDYQSSEKALNIIRNIHVVSNRCIFESTKSSEINPLESASILPSTAILSSPTSPSSPKSSAFKFQHSINPQDHPDMYTNKYVAYGWGNSELPLGKLLNFHDPVIHVLNKRSSSFLTSCKFFHSSNETSRTNLLLLGDSPGDILMADGMNYDTNKCLKIGFLNDKIEMKIDHYTDIFDMVILGDEAGFEVINEILMNIGSSSSSSDELPALNLRLHDEFMALDREPSFQLLTKQMRSLSSVSKQSMDDHPIVV